MRSLVKRYKMGNPTMRMLITKDLKMKSRAVTTKNQISQRHRLGPCKMLVSWIKSKSSDSKMRIFLDEKVFTVNPMLNRGNSRYNSGDRAEDVDSAVKYSSKN